MIARRSLMAVALGLFMSFGMLISCGEQRHSEDGVALDVKRIDSLIFAKFMDNPNDVLVSIDSLEKSGQISPSVVCYFRGHYYIMMKQRAISEMFFKKALEGDDLLHESPELFYRACDYLSVSLSNRGEHAEALSVVTRCYEVSRKDETSQGKRWTAIMLHEMGYFQTQLGMHDEAEKNFSMAYMVLSQMTQADNSYENKRIYARVTYNILDAYMTTCQYDKAWEWMSLAEDAAESLSEDSECTEQGRANSVGGVAVHKAFVMLKKGDVSSAELSYKKAYESGYFNTTTGIMEQAAFLREAGRWDELVDMIPKADSVARVWNVPMSLYYVKEYMAPKFNTYLKSGRKEQAMEIAEDMVASMDSVSAYELRRKEREIAFIVAQKDQNVAMAEQETAVAYRWVKILAIAFSLLVLAVLAYATYYFIRKNKRSQNI